MGVKYSISRFIFQGATKFMWILTVRTSDNKPVDYTIKPKASSIGRLKDNDIVIPDESASRHHAQLNYDPQTNGLTVRDLGSKNGTFINRHRLTENIEFALNTHDTLRIGSAEMLLRFQSESEELIDSQASGFQTFSRELLIESFDNHAVLLYEVIQQLNNVLDVNEALQEVSRLLSTTLGADKCRVILAEDFDRISDLGFPTTIAKFAIDKQSTVLLPNSGQEGSKLLTDSAAFLRVHTVMCAPVVIKGKTIALVYMYKTNPQSRHFNQRDLQLAVAVGHLTSLTIERVGLMDTIQEEHRIRQFLQRFVAPTEAEFLLRNYLDSGKLPELQEMNSTVLFADIAGSSSIAEKLGPRRFGELLNRYYQDVTNVIFEHGGLLDKYLGDGFMAVFGMNNLQKDPEERAVSAGMEILKLLAAGYRDKDNHIDVGIGINTGSIVAGYVSTKERLELSVLGDTVNVAARLEAMARPNRILIGPETHSAINGHFKTQSLGDQTIKGRTQPISVHEVLTQ
jgi:adenylate cyclase